MMPPKKSKAARGGSTARAEEKDEQKNASETDAEKENKNKVNGDAEVLSDDEEENHVNIFEETIVDGKRKRTEPPGEAKLKEWIGKNFEEKEGVHYKFMDLYDAYVEECISEGAVGCLEGVFRRVLTEKFPKGYALKEDSKYKSDIKERKKIVRPKVQGDTFKLKPKEVLEKAFEDLGNPKAGVRFNTIRQYIAGKYPALRVDVKPNYVKNALFMGVRYGYISLLRGVGKSGVYRLYVDGEEDDDEDEDEDEEKPKKKVKSAKKEDKEKESENDSEAKDENDTEEEEKEEKEEEKEGDDEESKDKKEDEKDKKKPKKKKPAPVPKSRQGKIIHSDPAKIEDTFPLAITFGTEPKQCSYRKIANYISLHYPDTNVDARLKACLEKGAEKGFWEHISGAVCSGTFKLTIDEFDPTDDDDMIGKVVNAIMACSEPKQCSAALLKNYIVEFHPDFRVSDHPNRFKRALDRAENSRDLIRLSGIGASGSFQLHYVFAPSPAILAAQDTASDYEEDSEDDVSLPEKDEKGEVDLSIFQDAYVPRPSKRRGKARTVSKSSFYEREMEFQKNREVVTIRRHANNVGRPKKVVKKVDVKKEKGKKKGKKSARNKVARRTYVDASTDSEDSQEDMLDEEDEESVDEYLPGAMKKKKEKKENEFDEAYRPRPSASRSGRKRTPPRIKISKAKKVKATKATPKPTKSKAAVSTPTKAALKAKPVELESEDEEEEPPVKKAKKTPTPAKKGKKSSKPVEVESEDEEEPPAKKAKKTPTPAKKSPPPKKGSRASSRRR